MHFLLMIDRLSHRQKGKGIVQGGVSPSRSMSCQLIWTGQRAPVT
jgi:hypothetical protein